MRRPPKAQACLWPRVQLRDNTFDSYTLLWDGNKCDQNSKILIPALSFFSLSSALPYMFIRKSIVSQFEFHMHKWEEKENDRETEREREN